MQTSLSIMDWLTLLSLGALLGAAGQVIRQVAGFKKLLDENPGKPLGPLIDTSRVIITLLIGSVAGMLATLSIDILDQKLATQTLLTVITAGYAGTDFIESFMKTDSKKDKIDQFDTQKERGYESLIDWFSRCRNSQRMRATTPAQG